MKKLLVVLLLLGSRAVAQTGNDDPINFDSGWKFFRGGVERGYDSLLADSDWRTLTLPHDWSIEDLPGTHSPFDSNAVSQLGGGFTTGGTAWYRKRFAAPPGGKTVRLIFEGVYMNADVWLNGFLLGNHPYGYTSFSYDITGLVRPGGNNLLAVQVKNEGQNSRWYSGSGINRHVWLQTTDPVHFTLWGTTIRTAQVTAKSAEINADAGYEFPMASEPVSGTYLLIGPKGDSITAGRTTGTGTGPNNGFLHFRITLKNPLRWSTETPSLYKLICRLYAGGKLCQEAETVFGVRAISFDAGTGFLLNGIPVKLKGGCYHNDNGPLGGRSFDRAEERRVELMKASGFNAIRCSHNPPPPAFLEACDRLGMLVIDEAFDMWEDGKNPYDYHLWFKDNWQKDLTSMVRRDINHPSIIMWSIGNEIPSREKPAVVETARRLAAFIKEMDSTRPVTAAVNDVKPDKDPFFAALGVGGYNYAFDQYESDHSRVPSRIMMGTESYALEAFNYWMAALDHPYVIGDFIWTGFDYIGEASIGWKGYYQEKSFYPWTLAYCGDIDICGWKRPQSFYRDALWKKDQLSLFVKPPEPSFPVNPRIESWSKWNWMDACADWNWAGQENKPLEVSVYSSCEETELFLNGRSLGRKSTNRSTRFMAVYSVPYSPGTLRAVGYSRGKKAETAELVTAAAAVGLQLKADRQTVSADGQDLVYVTVTVVDAGGHRLPKAETRLQFSLDGPGEIAGLGNANPVSTESYQGTERKTWQGKCLVIIRSAGKPGRLILTVTGEELLPATVTLTATANR